MLGLGILRALLVTLTRARRTFFGESILKGKGMFTTQYPEERLVIPPRFRGVLMQLTEPETGEPRCTACTLCERACPVRCISIEVEGRGRERRLVSFLYNVGECMFCGLCAEACPEQALYLSPEYELAVYTHSDEDMIYDFERLLAIGEKYAPDGVPPSEREE